MFYSRVSHEEGLSMLTSWMHTIQKSSTVAVKENNKMSAEPSATATFSGGGFKKGGFSQKGFATTSRTSRFGGRFGSSATPPSTTSNPSDTQPNTQLSDSLQRIHKTASSYFSEIFNRLDANGWVAYACPALPSNTTKEVYWGSAPIASLVANRSANEHFPLGRTIEFRKAPLQQLGAEDAVVPSSVTCSDGSVFFTSLVMAMLLTQEDNVGESILDGRWSILRRKKESSIICEYEMLDFASFVHFAAGVGGLVARMGHADVVAASTTDTNSVPPQTDYFTVFSDLLQSADDPVLSPTTITTQRCALRGTRSFSRSAATAPSSTQDVVVLSFEDGCLIQHLLLSPTMHIVESVEATLQSTQRVLTGAAVAAKLIERFDLSAFATPSAITSLPTTPTAADLLSVFPTSTVRVQKLSSKKKASSWGGRDASKDAWLLADKMGMLQAAQWGYSPTRSTQSNSAVSHDAWCHGGLLLCLALIESLWSLHQKRIKSNGEQDHHDDAWLSKEELVHTLFHRNFSDAVVTRLCHTRHVIRHGSGPSVSALNYPLAVYSCHHNLPKLGGIDSMIPFIDGVHEQTGALASVLQLTREVYSALSIATPLPSIEVFPPTLGFQRRSLESLVGDGTTLNDLDDPSTEYYYFNRNVLLLELCRGMYGKVVNDRVIIIPRNNLEAAQHAQHRALSLMPLHLTLYACYSRCLPVMMPSTLHTTLCGLPPTPPRLTELLQQCSPMAVATNTSLLDTADRWCSIELNAVLTGNETLQDFVEATRMKRCLALSGLEMLFPSDVVYCIIGEFLLPTKGSWWAWVSGVRDGPALTPSRVDDPSKNESVPYFLRFDPQKQRNANQSASSEATGECAWETRVALEHFGLLSVRTGAFVVTQHDHDMYNGVEAKKRMQAHSSDIGFASIL